MSKDEVIEKLAARTGSSKDDVSNLLNEFLDLITDTLDNNENVDLEGFGAFYTEVSPTVSGVNPHTGQAQLSNPRRRARFKAGAELNSSVS
jgi:DNA-binding protein HU-beta